MTVWKNCVTITYIIKKHKERNMQNTVHVLQLQGTGNEESAFENAGVFSTQAQAVEKLASINAEYVDVDYVVFTLNENARIETHTVNA